MRIRTVVRSGSTLSSRFDMSARISINPLPRPRFAGRGPFQRPLFDTTRISLSSSRAPRIVTRPFACSIPFAAASWMASTTASLWLAGTSTLSSHAARSCRSRRKRERSGGSEASKGSTHNWFHAQPGSKTLLLVASPGRYGPDTESATLGCPLSTRTASSREWTQSSRFTRPDNSKAVRTIAVAPS